MTKYKKGFVLVLISFISLIRLLSLSKRDKVLAAYDVRNNVIAPTMIINTSTPIPTHTSTPTPSMLFVAPTEIPQQTSSENSFIEKINVYRASKGIGPLNTDSHTCEFAAIRAQEVASDFSHNGFYGRQELSELPYPSYTTVSENIANAPGGNPVSMWIASPSHEANLVQNVTYGCVVQSGDYYVYEGWTP